MLACLPASGDPVFRLLHRTQMNTGLQKWETTQKMRSASHPTPAELDAYAKTVANKPLSIQIFPNSIKVPQKKHIRRTVNGLDTSSSAQRHSPYPPQLAAGHGLLAVLRAPLRGLVKQPDGCRTRLQLKATMNPQSGPYAAPSTLNLPHLAPQKQGAGHPQQSLAHPMALQHHQRSMAHSQGLQQQRLTHPPAIQRQPPPQDVAPCAAAMPQQHLPHMQTLKHQAAPAQALGATQELRHVPDSAALQAALPGPPALPPPPPPYGARKLPDADAPPNVTVSTSTIPLSMAASLQQARPGDLSSIVLQINQLCQARAGMGATSVCEGQIANPSPISRNQLISASSRVSQHASGAGAVSSCLLMDKPAAPAPAAVSSNNNMAAFHPDSDKQLQQHLLQQKQQQHHLQQLQQQQRSWAQHQLAHMQQPPEGAHPCKNPRLDPAAECAFPSHGLSYGHKPPAAAAHGFPLKHAADKTLPPSSANCSYLNGHYLQPAWGAVPAAAGNNGNIPQDLPVGFPGGHAAGGAAAERVPGAKYRPGKDGSAGQPKLLQPSVDFLGEDFQIPGTQEQSVEMMHKMHRGGGGHHHQGYH